MHGFSRRGAQHDAIISDEPAGQKGGVVDALNYIAPGEHHDMQNIKQQPCHPYNFSRQGHKIGKIFPFQQKKHGKSPKQTGRNRVFILFAAHAGAPHQFRQTHQANHCSQHHQSMTSALQTGFPKAPAHQPKSCAQTAHRHGEIL